MHQSIPGASLPPLPPPGNCGAFAHLASPGGWGISTFSARVSVCQPRATPVLPLLVRASLSKHSKHGGFYWKHKQIQSSANLKREILVKVFKGMFSQFYACFSSLLIKPQVGSYRHESTHSFGYGMKLLLIQDLNKFSSDDISNSTMINCISYSRHFLYFLMLLNYSGQITFNTVHWVTQYSNKDKQQ